MATFHPFPHLPLELRILIWEQAVEERVLKIRKAKHAPTINLYWSPTPIPAVTRACRESRKYNRYQKAFIKSPSPRYIWADFDSDSIQTERGVLNVYLPKYDIKHLRFDTAKCERREPIYWLLEHIYPITKYPNLQSVDILVKKGELVHWAVFFKTVRLGVCPMENVRFVDRSTGEWIDKATRDGYHDYVDSNGGERTDSYTRAVDGPDEALERAEARRRLQIPLPRITLGDLDD
jgi:hypothetical protein